MQQVVAIQSPGKPKHFGLTFYSIHMTFYTNLKYVQGVPKKAQHLLILSISKDLVIVSFVHLYDVGKIFSHNCGKIQTKYLNGH